MKYIRQYYITKILHRTMLGFSRWEKCCNLEWFSYDAARKHLDEKLPNATTKVVLCREYEVTNEQIEPYRF